MLPKWELMVNVFRPSRRSVLRLGGGSASLSACQALGRAEPVLQQIFGVRCAGGFARRPLISVQRTLTPVSCSMRIHRPLLKGAASLERLSVLPRCIFTHPMQGAEIPKTPGEEQNKNTISFGFAGFLGPSPRLVLGHLQHLLVRGRHATRLPAHAPGLYPTVPTS